ncbi:MAG TPA: SufD family Fe-S cluster assembly protein [Terricaulis sp.]|nr:SufD family Fe-S cluster assembly protein [Terricaulis sp.]
MNAAQLPTRRDEAWKYSDLRAAVGADAVALREAPDVIERLAPRTDVLSVARGEARVVVERLNSETGVEAVAQDWRVAEGAALVRVVLQTGAAIGLSLARVELAAGARLQQFVLAEGGKLARVETHIVAGEGAEVELNGVYMCAAGRHADLTSIITHADPNGATRQLIKGVVRKGGRGVFQGKIVVAPHAQKTDARQYHHGMLLEDGAEIFAKPELMIHADDVQCAHGNTAGGLDESALFYMRARGVPEAAARALLIEAFLLEAVPSDLPAEAREEIEGRIRAWLAEARA